MSLLLLLRILRPGVEPVPTGIRVFWLVRTEHISWSEIERIDIHRPWIGRQVLLRLRNGKAVKLPAPGWWWPATSDGFDEEAALIRQWWARDQS